jgi:hypothetical protein
MMRPCSGMWTFVIGALVVVLSCVSLSAAIPRGWYLEGTKPADYEVAVDHEADYRHNASAVLRAKSPTAEGFGTLMQQVRADNYRGKRVRFGGNLKAERVQDWAGLWMRVNKDNLVIGFDNMQNRAVKGTRRWLYCEIVLEVPPEATDISFGVLLSGAGEVWLSHPVFEAVQSNVPTTGHAIKPFEMEQVSKAEFPQVPVNLDLEN